MTGGNIGMGRAMSRKKLSSFNRLCLFQIVLDFKGHLQPYYKNYVARVEMTHISQTPILTMHFLADIYKTSSIYPLD